MVVAVMVVVVKADYYHHHHLHHHLTLVEDNYQSEARCQLLSIAIFCFIFEVFSQGDARMMFWSPASALHASARDGRHECGAALLQGECWGGGVGVVGVEISDS